MPATYEPIASTTVSSATASITTSNIPSTYTDLIIVCRAGTSYGDNQVWTMRFNSDTGSNYSMTRLGGDGSSAYSDRWTSQTSIDAGFLPTGGLGTSIIQVQSYANTNVNKTSLIAIETQASTSGNSGRKYVARQVGLWRSTAAITSVTFAFTNNMVSGSSVSLYGIKASA